MGGGSAEGGRSTIAVIVTAAFDTSDDHRVSWDEALQARMEPALAMVHACIG